MPDIKTVTNEDIQEQREKTRAEARKRLQENLAKLAPPDGETPEGDQPAGFEPGTAPDGEQPAAETETPEGDQPVVEPGEGEHPEGELPAAAAGTIPDGWQEVLVETENGIIKSLIPKDANADSFKGGYMQRADYNRRVNAVGRFGKKYLRQIEDGTIDTFDPHFQQALRDPEFRILADELLRRRAAGMPTVLADPTQRFEPKTAPAVEESPVDDDLPSDPLVERALDKRFKPFEKRFERFDKLADTFEQQLQIPRQQAEQQARGEIWAQTVRYDLATRFPQAFKGTPEDDPFIFALVKDAMEDNIFDTGPDGRPLVTVAGIVSSFRKGTVKPPNATDTTTPEATRTAPASVAVAAVQADAKRKAAEASRVLGARVAGPGGGGAAPRTQKDAPVKVSTKHPDGRPKTSREFTADILAEQAKQAAAGRR